VSKPDTEYRIDPATLQSCRESRKWSRADLAEKAFIRDPSYIYQLESTPHNCGVNTAKRLADALGCSIEYLIGAFPKGGKE